MTVDFECAVTNLIIDWIRQHKPFQQLLRVMKKDFENAGMTPNSAQLMPAKACRQAFQLHSTQLVDEGANEDVWTAIHDLVWDQVCWDAVATQGCWTEDQFTDERRANMTVFKS